MSEPTPNYVRAIEAAGVAAAMSDRSTAERALRAAIESVDDLGPDDADLVILLNDLVRLCLKNASYAMAEPLVLRLLEIKRAKGEEHPEFATVLATLAAVRQSMGRNDDAEQLWRRVIAIREQTLAPNHFSLATAYEHLSDTCAARGKFADALQCAQRAVAIREVTLGREHASLRTSRERIADLELMAAEDTLDRATPASSGPHPRPILVLDSAAPPPAAVPPRVTPPRPVAAIPSEPAALAPQPAARTSNPAALAPQPPARTSNPPAVASPRRPSPVPPVAAVQRRSPPAVPVPVKPEAYLSVLETLKSEIDLDQSDLPATTDRSRMAALVLLLRQPRVAAIAGIGAISVPLAAWGIVGALRSPELNWVDKPAAAVAVPDTHAVAVLAGAGATTGVADRRRDSVAAPATKAGTSASRGTDAGARSTAEPLIKLDAGRRLNISLESVGASVPLPAAGAGAEPVLRHLNQSSDVAAAKPGVAMGAPTRARMIGQLPTPRYPAQQLRGGAGGSVRVRFDVDTTGRPVMSTFAVVSTPLQQLVAPVREVIPGIRFEPARTPWPESRAMVETVELTFNFAPPARR